MTLPASLENALGNGRPVREIRDYWIQTVIRDDFIQLVVHERMSKPKRGRRG